MAVHAVVLHHARNSQMEARSKLEAMVACSEHLLLTRQVYVLDVDIVSAELHADLGNKSVKIKLQVCDKTLLKSNSVKARDLRTTVDGTASRVSFGNSNSFIFEGGDALQVSLHEVSWASTSSHKLASGQVAFREVFGAKVDEYACANHVSAPLRAMEAPHDILATVSLRLHARTCELRAAGGAKALKMISLPSRPKPAGKCAVLELNDDARDAKEFCAHADLACASLRKAKQIADEISCQDAGESGGANKHAEDNLRTDGCDSASTSCGSSADGLE